jgi:tRNA dimethylallyltransferase
VSAAPIIALVGPTGVGKTERALQVAARLDAEIVNADSRQVYRYLDIGSAKPTPAQQAEVRHHLLDVVNPDEPFNCAGYRELALQAIADIQGRNRRVLLVGGTGLYLKVLMGGLVSGPPRDPDLRHQLEGDEQANPGCLHERLRRIDPVTAGRLHPHDRLRIVRALEVALLTHRPISEWQAAHAFADGSLHIVPIGLTLERPLLYERINHRCHAMVEAGLIDEVRSVWGRGFGPDLASLRSIGYGEIGAFLRGEMTLGAALDHMARATRHFAKRQLTWFRKTPELRWLDARCGTEEIIAATT